MAVVLVALTAASAGAATKHHKSPTISKAAAGKQYLALVAPVNAALSGFITTAHGWGNSTTNQKAESEATPAIRSIQTLNTKLLADKWPASAQSDVKALVRADAPLAGDLQGLSSVNLLNASSWTATFQRDASALGAAVGIVRSDLGLPAAAGSG